MQQQCFKCSVAICGYCTAQFRSEILFFPNIIFLLIFGNFHCILTTSQSSQIHPSLETSPQKRERKEKKCTKCNLCCSYTHLSMVKLSVTSLLKENEPPALHQKTSTMKSYTFCIHIIIFKGSLQWLFFSGCMCMYVTKTLNDSFSTVSLHS